MGRAGTQSRRRYAALAGRNGQIVTRYRRDGRGERRLGSARRRHVIPIKNVCPDDQLEAAYFDPGRLPFAKAQASREGATLRAAGTTPRPARSSTIPGGRLKGTYQAVAEQKFEVGFVRDDRAEAALQYGGSNTPLWRLHPRAILDACPHPLLPWKRIR